MMQRLANDPVFWAALTAILGLVGVWAKAKTAEYEARNAQSKAQVVAEGQGAQQATLTQHTAQIAALEAVSGSAAQTEVRAAGAIAPAPAGAPVSAAWVPAAGTAAPAFHGAGGSRQVVDTPGSGYSVSAVAPVAAPPGAAPPPEQTTP